MELTAVEGHARRRADAAVREPVSWRSKPLEQQPVWPDASAVAETCDQLRKHPGLVPAAQVVRLRRQLADVASGRTFVIMGGDCAEPFGARLEDVRATLAVLQRLSEIVSDALDIPVIQVGRLAGQYAKPRSSPVEWVDGRALPAFRGEMVNDSRADLEARTPDPRRLIRAYRESQRTLRVVRQSAASRGVEVSIGHEALVLDYEESLVRPDNEGRWYGASAHLLWVGERTRRPDGAHVDFLAGIGNPVACKVGPNVSPVDLLAVCELLDPDRTPGRLTLIPRMGAEAVWTSLPPLVRAVQEVGHPVAWVCDPMHGNTVLDPAGRKVRYLSSVVAELVGFVEVLSAEDAWAGGIHIEMTGADVLECGEQPGDVVPADRSTTLCDPRLNAPQAIELTRHVARVLSMGISRVRGRAG